MEPDKPTTIRVLLVDSTRDSYLTLRSLLAGIASPVFNVSSASSYPQGLLAIGRRAHDIYLINNQLEDQTGLELLKAADLQQRSEPFILLDDSQDDHTEQQAIALGASDYLVKNQLDSTALIHSLRYAWQRKRMEERRLRHLIDVNRAKDEFISLASHQLRTPATAVKQYLGMVLEGYVGDLNDNQKAMLETAYSSNERQLQIVSDLLRVAKIDAGRVQLHKTPVDLGRLIEEVIDELSSKFRQQRQQAIFDKPAVPTPALAEVDKENFRMVLENIVDNASKYSGPETTITIQLATTPETIAVSVTDQGVGIKPEDHGKLFIKFSRIDNPLSTEVGGSGLGLYWAKKIVDLHNGTIGIASEEGQGSTFTITLPR